MVFFALSKVWLNLLLANSALHIPSTSTFVKKCNCNVRASELPRILYRHLKRLSRMKNIIGDQRMCNMLPPPINIRGSRDKIFETLRTCFLESRVLLFAFVKRLKKRLNTVGLGTMAQHARRWVLPVAKLVGTAVRIDGP